MKAWRSLHISSITLLALLPMAAAAVVVPPLPKMALSRLSIVLD